MEVALSAGSDTADLLGGFEQLEPARAAQVCISRSAATCGCIVYTIVVNFVETALSAIQDEHLSICLLVCFPLCLCGGKSCIHVIGSIIACAVLPCRKQ